MQITDEYVLQYLENLKIWTEKNIKDTNVLSYLKNRFVDSKSISETYIRIKYNIQTRPVCRYCGKEVKFYFNRSKNTYAFSKHCSYSCSAKNPETFELKCKTKELHFGDKNYNNREKYKLTCQAKFGEGITNAFQATEIKEKCKNTKLDKYGDAFYNNPDKVKETNLRRIGVEMPFQSPIILQKCRNKCLEKFGVDNPAKSDIIKEKTKLTNIKRYNNEWVIASEYVRNKSKITSLLRYNFPYPIQSDICKQRLSRVLRTEEVQRKSINTKKKNKSFNTSKPENKFYNEVLKYFPLAKHNYRSEKYPFNCDIYIPELDLYIELNYFWTHGFHEFNDQSIDDLKRLESLKTRAKGKNMYHAAIDVWTKRDKEKIQIAKKNNLNYLIFLEYN